MKESEAVLAQPAVVERMEIEASPDQIFDALVEPEQLRQWWGSSDMYRTEWEIDLRVGGQYLCTATAGDMTMTVTGRFLEIDRPRRLVYTWNASWDPSGETTVRYDLTPRGASTLVMVTQTRFAPDADRAGYGEGWVRILNWLAGFVQRSA